MRSRATTVQQPSRDEDRNTATILVVDDEPAVRTVMCEVLQRQGYRVLACETGGQALEVLAGGSAQIDLVLLDLTLPDMHGEQLMVDLRKIRPGVPVVSSSGYPVAPGVGQPDMGYTSYLKKPFDAQALSNAVSHALSRAPGNVKLP